MKYAVMGAGAVGCYYGGMLARAGHAVTLVGRAALVQAVREHGLRLQTLRFDEQVTLNACTSPQGVAGADVLLFCVKSSDTESAGAALLPHLGPHTWVLSLQNGVDNAARLSQVLGRTVTPAVVYVAAGMVAAGHVQHHGRGDLLIGPSPHPQAPWATLLQECTAAGIGLAQSDQVQGELWVKLIINCAYNALSALTRMPYAELVRQPGVWEVMRDVERECLAVAQAEGVQLPQATWPAIEAIAHTMATQFSSTARDLLQGKRTEIEHLNGYVVQRAAAHGLAATANHLLLTLVRALEPQQPPT